MRRALVALGIAVASLVAPGRCGADVAWRLHLAEPAQWEPTIGVAALLRVPLVPRPNRPARRAVLRP